MSVPTASRLAGRVLTQAPRLSPRFTPSISLLRLPHLTRPPYPIRTFSTTQSHSSQPTSNTHPPPPTTPQKTYYSLFPSTLPHGPPPKGSFHIDLRALRSEFLKRQQSTHPDLFPPEQRKTAETASAQLNKAYTTLSSPLTRAEYLLTLRGYIDPSSDETQRLEDHEFIMEVLEANEVLESAKEEAELEELRVRNKERVEESVRRIGELFERDEVEKVREEVTRLRYWVNVGEALREWEPGKGVHLQH